MTQKFANAARAELNANINDTDASLTIVSGGALFPVANLGAVSITQATISTWFKLTLQDLTGIEIVYCRTHTSASNSFSNILRGQEGTTARAFLAGAVVGLRPTALDSEEFEAMFRSMAPLASPALTGTPTAPTAAAATNTTQVATTAFVEAARVILAAADALKAPLASPALTGIITIPTGGSNTAPILAIAGDSNTGLYQGGSADQLAITAGGTLVFLAATAGVTLNGTPAAPTAAPGTNTTQIATTAFVAALGALKANIASPTFTDQITVGDFLIQKVLSDYYLRPGVANSGIVYFGSSAAQTGRLIITDAGGQLNGIWQVATASPGTNTVQAASTAFVAALGALKADLASPTFTGTPAAPTASPGTNTTQLATTAFVAALGALKADLASPTLTGTPLAPTAAAATDTTQISTTAYVQAEKRLLAVNNQTSTTYTLVLADAGKRVDMNNASAQTLTVPTNATVAFPVGTAIHVSMSGAGLTSIAAAGGVTINTADGLKLYKRYAMASLYKTATDTWLLIGTIA